MSPCVFTSKPDKATRCTHAGDVVMRFCAPQGGCLLHLCAVRWRMGWAVDWFSSISKAFGPFLRFLILLCLSAVPLLTSLLSLFLWLCALLFPSFLQSTFFSSFSVVIFFFFLHTTLLPLLHISLNPIFLQFACFKFLCIYRLSLASLWRLIFLSWLHAHTRTHIYIDGLFCLQLKRTSLFPFPKQAHNRKCPCYLVAYQRY